MFWSNNVTCFICCLFHIERANGFLLYNIGDVIRQTKSYIIHFHYEDFYRADYITPTTLNNLFENVCNPIANQFTSALTQQGSQAVCNLFLLIVNGMPDSGNGQDMI